MTCFASGLVGSDFRTILLGSLRHGLTSVLPVRALGELHLSQGLLYGMTTLAYSDRVSIMVGPKRKAAKRGRPYAGGRDPLVSIRLSAETIAALDAKAEGGSRSDLIRRYVEAGLKRK